MIALGSKFWPELPPSLTIGDDKKITNKAK